MVDQAIRYKTAILGRIDLHPKSLYRIHGRPGLSEAVTKRLMGMRLSHAEGSPSLLGWLIREP